MAIKKQLSRPLSQTDYAALSDAVNHLTNSSRQSSELIEKPHLPKRSARLQPLQRRASNFDVIHDITTSKSSHSSLKARLKTAVARPMSASSAPEEFKAYEAVQPEPSSGVGGNDEVQLTPDSIEIASEAEAQTNTAATNYSQAGVARPTGYAPLSSQHHPTVFDTNEYHLPLTPPVRTHHKTEGFLTAGLVSLLILLITAAVVVLTAILA
jgi:hypothetical protein